MAVDPSMLSPLSGMAIAAASYYNGVEQRKQNLQLELLRAWMRRQERAQQRHFEQEDFVNRVLHEREMQAQNQEWQDVRKHYPFNKLPGEIAIGMHRMYPNDFSCPRPIVVIEPPKIDPTGLWKTLCNEALLDLSTPELARQFHVEVADRPLGWPCCSHVIENEFVGRAAIIVSVQIGVGRFALSVGGYNLALPIEESGMSEGSDVFQMVKALDVPYRESAELKRYTMQRVVDSASKKEVLLPHFRGSTPDNGMNEFEHQRNLLQFGRAAIALLTARMVDYYYLARSYAYDPLFYRLLEHFRVQERTLGSATLISEDEIPKDIEEQFILDLPHYRLGRLEDSSGGSPDERIRCISTSLAAYGGKDHATDLASVVNLLKTFSPSSTESTKALRNANSILKELPVETPGRSDLIAVVTAAIARSDECDAQKATMRADRLKWRF